MGAAVLDRRVVVVREVVFLAVGLLVAVQRLLAVADQQFVDELKGHVVVFTRAPDHAAEELGVAEGLDQTLMHFGVLHDHVFDVLVAGPGGDGVTAGAAEGEEAVGQVVVGDAASLEGVHQASEGDEQLTFLHDETFQRRVELIATEVTMADDDIAVPLWVLLDQAADDGLRLEGEES